MRLKNRVKELLALADIKINGNRSWDIQVHNNKFYRRVLAQGSLGLGESYMDCDWDCKNIDQFICRVLKAKLNKKVKPLKLLLLILKAKLLNLQTKRRSKQVAEKHYNLGNDLYKLMLDKNMQYTCAYWKNTKNLEVAQEHKLKLICEKLKLKKGMTILELGGGFGGFARYVSKNYKCKVVSYNISKEQIKYARKICKGLPVQIIESDYRNAKGAYDRVVAIGLCEHIGYKNYRTLMEVAHRCLKDEGLFFIHTIGRNESIVHMDHWLDKYIFQSGMLPSIKQISDVAENLFIMEDWHNFGTDYDKTLMAWWDNFNKNWPKLKDKYDERFYRMWKYYLLSCAGGFRARHIQLWHIVYSKNGIPGGYERVS